MFQFYFCIIIVVFIALSIGLVSGIYFRPPEFYTDQEIYFFAGKISAGIILLALGIILLLTKTKAYKNQKHKIQELIEIIKEERK